MGAPALWRGVRKYCKLCLERPDRDSRGEKIQVLSVRMSRLARTNGSELQGGVNRFVRPKDGKCGCNGLRCRGPSGIRPEAQMSDPMNWDLLLSPELWIQGVKLSPDPGLIEV